MNYLHSTFRLDISTIFVNEDSAFISWPPFGNQFQYINSYSIFIFDSNSATVADDVTDVNAYYINKLTPSTQYTFTVRNTHLQPERTRAITFTTTPEGKVSHIQQYRSIIVIIKYLYSIEIIHPLYLMLTNVNSTAIDVSWSSPPLDTGDTVTQFSLTYSSVEIDEEDRNVALTADILSYTIVGLEEYITYSVTVESYTELKGKTGESIEEITTLGSGKCKYIRSTKDSIYTNENSTNSTCYISKPVI